MKKNVLIISSSPRVNSNSLGLCQQFCKGAKESGHNVELVNLQNTKIGYCIGCYACQNTGKCFQKDDMQDIQQKMLNADVIVFATPVYFYSMSAQLKTLIDRTTPFYTQVRADIYLFATAWDSDKNNLLSTIEAMRGLTRDCFENCQEKGVIVCADTHGQGDVISKPEYNTAYEMGKNC
ncbi:MAG: flavodoxin family protein [Clostridia bacterium]|nr:flavodoxin family protein [Clostridia bacterium]